MNFKNPFANSLALANSSYTAYKQGHLVLPFDEDRHPSPLAELVHSQFRALILNPSFPCIGARAAFNQGTYRFAMYPTMGSPEATAGLCHDLFYFVHEQDEMESEFTTFVACFSGPAPVDERHFESLLWRQLQSLHNEDITYHKWDETASQDSNDPHFSFSIAGRAFFIVGLNSSSSRWDRKFAWPTLVFNAKRQFDRLRETGRFNRFQSIIRQREVQLQGNINPNLANFGDDTESKQYSGRPIEKEWKCPFHTQPVRTPPDTKQEEVLGKSEKEVAA